MRRRLVVVDNDSDGVMGDNHYDDFNDAMDFAVVAMALLPSSRWRRCHCRCAGVAIAMTAKMPAHRRWATTQPVMRRQRVERRRRRIARQRRLEDERRRQRDKWGVASCNNQMAKKRSRQSREAELAAARQQVRRDNQLANKRQTGGEAYKTNGRGGVSGQEAAERREDKRRRWPAARREASRQPAGGASGASEPSSASFPPPRDGGAPPKIPSNGGGSDVSCVVREFGIGEICASTVVVVDPLTSLPSSPPSDARRALLAAAAPAAKQQLRLQR